MAGALVADDGTPGRYRLRGPVVFATARAILDEGRQLFAAAPPSAFDLSGVEAIDSAGLALLLTWCAEGRAAGRSVTFGNPPAALVALARISDVDAILGLAAA